MEDCTKLAIENYKATMKVKYHLRAEGAASTTMRVSSQMWKYQCHVDAQ